MGSLDDSNPHDWAKRLLWFQFNVTQMTTLWWTNSVITVRTKRDSSILSQNLNSFFNRRCPRRIELPYNFKIYHSIVKLLPPFSLIRDFRKQNTHGNVSEVSVNHTCYRQIGSKSTNHSPLAWCKEGLKVKLVAVIGGFRSALSITRKTDGNFANVFAAVLFSKVANQGKRW